MSKCFSFVPKFDPDNCELFFEMFEKMCSSATVVEGKVGDPYSGLS